MNTSHWFRRQHNGTFLPTGVIGWHAAEFSSFRIVPFSEIRTYVRRNSQISSCFRLFTICLLLNDHEYIVYLVVLIIRAGIVFIEAEEELTLTQILLITM